MTHRFWSRKQKSAKALKYYYDTSIYNLIEYYTKMIRRQKTMSCQIETVRQSYKNLPPEIKDLLYLNLKNDRKGDAPTPSIREIVTLSIPIFVIMITQFGNAMDKFSASSYASVASFLKDNPEQSQTITASFQDMVSWALGIGKICSLLLFLMIGAYMFDALSILYHNSRERKRRLLADIIVMLHDQENSDCNENITELPGANSTWDQAER